MNLIRYTILLSLLFSGCFCFAQSRTDLETKKKAIMKDIAVTSKLIDETKQKKQHSLSELKTLDRQIKMRQALISNINEQIRLLDKQIASKQDEVTLLGNDLQRLREEYGKMVYYSYKHQSAMNKLLFVFSSASFNDAYQRIKYMEQYADFRQNQAKNIIVKRDELEIKIEVLKKERNEKTRLVTNKEQEKKTLDEEKEEKNAVVNTLKKKEQKLLSNLKKKQKNAEKLNKAIEDIIKREIEEARRRAAAASKGNPNALALTPEAAKLSAGFASNKGKLPWPVTNGIITGTFGEHPHPILKLVKEKNNGIDIKTNQGSDARVIFDGVVSNVLFNPGFQKAVIIRHGDYFTVYSHLDEVSVMPGDKVQVKQVIGKVYTDDELAKTEIHLEIWKSTTKMNPSDWLLK